MRTTLAAIVMGLTAGVILALTTSVRAADPTDPAENLRRIEQLELRARRVSVTAGSEQYLSPERDNPAVSALPHPQPDKIDPKKANQPEQPADSTQPLEPERIAYEQRRPWMLTRQPWPGAVKVRGGWLIHQDDADRAGFHGFYRSLTPAEADQLKQSSIH